LATAPYWDVVASEMRTLVASDFPFAAGYQEYPIGSSYQTRRGCPVLSAVVRLNFSRTRSRSETVGHNAMHMARCGPLGNWGNCLLLPHAGFGAPNGCCTGRGCYQSWRIRRIGSSVGPDHGEAGNLLLALV